VNTVLIQKRFWLLMISAYAVLGLIIYSNVLQKGTFIFDDFEYIVGNPMIKDLTIFSHVSDPRHIGYLSFAMNDAIHGETPFGYHLVNIIIHIVNAIMVCFLIGLILQLLHYEEDRPAWRQAAAFFAGLLFLVHPVETQAVSYITQRFTSLSAFFYLGSVLLYLVARRRTEDGDEGLLSYLFYGLGVASCVLAMKTKEIAFTIPFMVGILEYALFRDSRFSYRRFTFLIPYAAALVVIPLSLLGPEWGLIDYGSGVDEVTRRDKLFDLYERSRFEYLINQFRVILIYLRLLVLPVNQLAVYDLQASRSFFDVRVIFSLAFLLAIAWAAFYSWRRASSAARADAPVFRLVTIGVVWFFVTLSIESSFIPIKDIIFEHRVYLPSVGFFAVFSGLFVSRIGRLVGPDHRAAKLGAAMMIIVIALSGATYARNFVWTNEVVFWDDVVRKTGKAIGYNNRGNAYAKEGRYDLALQDLDKTISFFPRADDPMAWENSDFTPNNIMKTYMSRGNIYAAMGDAERAKADFDMAKRVMQIR